MQPRPICRRSLTSITSPSPPAGRRRTPGQLRSPTASSGSASSTLETADLGGRGGRARGRRGLPVVVLRWPPGLRCHGRGQRVHRHHSPTPRDRSAAQAVGDRAVPAAGGDNAAQHALRPQPGHPKDQRELGVPAEGHLTEIAMVQGHRRGLIISALRISPKIAEPGAGNEKGPG